MRLNKTAEAFKKAAEENQYIRSLRKDRTLTTKASERADLNKIFTVAIGQIDRTLKSFHTGNREEVSNALDEIAKQSKILKERYAARAGNWFVRKGWIRSKRKEATLKSAEALMKKAIAAKHVFESNLTNKDLERLIAADPQSLFSLIEQSRNENSAFSVHADQLEMTAITQFEELFAHFAANNASAYEKGHWVMNGKLKPAFRSAMADQLLAYLPFIHYNKLNLSPDDIHKVSSCDHPKLKIFLHLIQSKPNLLDEKDFSLQEWLPILFKMARDNPALMSLGDVYLMTLIDQNEVTCLSQQFRAVVERYKQIKHFTAIIENQAVILGYDFSLLQEIVEDGLLKHQEFRDAFKCDQTFFRCLAGFEHPKPSDDLLTRWLKWLFRADNVPDKDLLLCDLMCLRVYEEAIKQNRLDAHQFNVLLSIMDKEYVKNGDVLKAIRQDIAFICNILNAEPTLNFTVRAIRYAMTVEQREEAYSELVLLKKIDSLLLTFTSAYMRDLCAIQSSGVLKDPRLVSHFGSDWPQLFALQQEKVAAGAPVTLKLVALLWNKLKAGQLRDADEGVEWWNKVVSLWTRKPGSTPGVFHKDDFSLLFEMMPVFGSILSHPPAQMLQAADFTTRAIVAVLKKIQAGTFANLEQAQAHLDAILQANDLRNALSKDKYSKEIILLLERTLESGILKDQDLDELLIDARQIMDYFIGDAVPEQYAPYALRAAYVRYKKFGLSLAPQADLFDYLLYVCRSIQQTPQTFSNWISISPFDILAFIDLLKEDEQQRDLLEKGLEYFIDLALGKPLDNYPYYLRALAATVQSVLAEEHGKGFRIYKRLCYSYKLREMLKGNTSPTECRHYFEVSRPDQKEFFDDLRMNGSFNQVIAELEDLLKDEFLLKAKWVAASIQVGSTLTPEHVFTMIKVLKEYEDNPGRTFADMDDISIDKLKEAIDLLRSIRSYPPAFEKLSELLPRASQLVEEDFFIAAGFLGHYVIRVSLPYVALHSDYFAAILAQGTNEVEDRRVRLREISIVTLFYLHSFFDHLALPDSINNHELRDLWKAADYLQMPLLKNAIESKVEVLLDFPDTAINPSDWKKLGVVVSEEDAAKAFETLPEILELKENDRLFWLPEDKSWLNKMPPEFVGFEWKSGWKVVTSAPLENLETFTFPSEGVMNPLEVTAYLKLFLLKYDQDITEDNVFAYCGWFNEGPLWVDNKFKLQSNLPEGAKISSYTLNL